MTDYRAKFDLDVQCINDLEVYAGGNLHIHDEDYQADNTARASFAACALDSYVKRVGESEMKTNVSDLLGDLMHLCDALGIDFDDAVYAGRRHYEEEIRGEL